MSFLFIFFFFNDTATTEIYTLSLHDALPISGIGLLVVPAALGWSGRGADAHVDGDGVRVRRSGGAARVPRGHRGDATGEDRKSTRLNSSHLVISYAVFCLKKKKNPRHVLAPR